MSDAPLPERTPTPRGETYVPSRDKARLNAQFLRVRAVMADGEWHTLREVAAATGDPEASVSARIRDLRRNGFTIFREYIDDGLWKYRAIKQEDSACVTSSSSSLESSAA